MKDVLFKITAFFLSLCFIFFFCELVLRIFKPAYIPLSAATSDSEDYLFPPNSSRDNISSLPGEFAVTVKFNNFGYRGENMTESPVRPRIFMVGDSFTFGVGAENDETIPALVEKKLRHKGYAAEVINAGI